MKLSCAVIVSAWAITASPAPAQQDANNSADIRITVQALREAIAKQPDSVLIIDVRATQKQYVDGHIPGAIWIPAEQLPQKIEQINESSTVVTYCT